MAGRRLEAIVLTDAERSELRMLASRPMTAQALAQRARIILKCAKGLENKDVSQRLGRASHDGGEVTTPVSRRTGRGANRRNPADDRG